MSQLHDVIIAFITSTLLLTVVNAGRIKQGDPRHWEYIIVGAGPAGLQLGHLLQRANRDYVILERSNISGSFFTLYPRHGRLISINKRHTGKTNKEFNLRHDWNSLLSDDDSLRFTKYSKLLFPDRLDYVKYLNDYQKKLGLKVLYNTDVHDIRRTTKDEGRGEKRTKTHLFVMKDLTGNIYTCRTLIIATGMWNPHAPPMVGEEFIEGYETVSVNADDFEGQTVLILGRGNAAFEVADHIYGSTNLIHMIGRSRVRLSWSTHYVGDLRGVNSALLDTYQLKSQDAMLEGNLDVIQVLRNGSRLILDVSTEFDEKQDNFAMREPYDRIIRCLGFRFNDSLFSEKDIRLRFGQGRKVKYPKIGHNYESVDIPGMFFVGTATHSLDFRKSAGGFVHGFRYTARALHRLLEQRNHAQSWPAHRGLVGDLLPFLVKRINEASGLYQMFGMLCDVIALHGDEFEYFEEFPVNLLHDFERHAGSVVSDVIVVTLEYGANFSGPGEDTFRINRATGDPAEASSSNFLHPVFSYYRRLPDKPAMNGRRRWEVLPRPDRVHHTVEDFLTSWNAPLSHVLPLRCFLENVIGRDLRQFVREDCFLLAMTHTTLPIGCRKEFSLSLSGVKAATMDMEKPTAMPEQVQGDDAFSCDKEHDHLAAFSSDIPIPTSSTVDLNCLK